MKKVVLLLFVFFTSSSFCQKTPLSGHYDLELELAFNPTTKKVTGYYENATGENSKFSCIFYIEGSVLGNSFTIQTYFPNDKATDLIIGTMEIVNANTIKIQLPEEHGGCWNVEHFADNPVNFELKTASKWIQINYIVKTIRFFKEKTKPKNNILFGYK